MATSIAFRAAAAALLLLFPAHASAAGRALPQVAHVTVVVMENRNYATVVGNPQARYFNDVLVPQGVLLRNSHAVTHPSEPNYLALFSGSTQGLTNDSCPHRYDVPNLASEVIAAGKSFVGYAESMPHNGFEGCFADGLYGRKHVPWTDFANVPRADSRVYSGIVNGWPSLAWVIPNMCHDMHDCSTGAGDEWMRANLSRIVAWDARNDGLLVVTWDEADPDTGTNRIPTLLIGPMVAPGARATAFVDHYGVLRTIEAVLGVPCLANACRVQAIQGIWR